MRNLLAALCFTSLLAASACSGNSVGETSSDGGSGGDGGSPSTTTTTSAEGGAPTCEQAPGSEGNGVLTPAWAQAFGDGTSSVTGSAIAAHADGTATLVGSVYGPVDLGSGVSFFSDGWFIARFDASGQALWASSPAGVPALISADALGFVFTVTAPAKLGGPTKLAKLGPGGQEIWSVSLPFEVTALSPAGDGGVVVKAEFSGSLAYGGASYESPWNLFSDVVVLGLDGGGALAWSSSIGATQPPPLEEGYAIVDSQDIAAMPSGGALVLSTVVRGGGETPETSERVVQRLGADGQVLWERHLAAYASSIRVVAAPDDGALLVGEIGLGQLNLGCTTHSARGLLLQALDAAGQPRWERSIPGHMGVSRPSFDAAGNLVLAGSVRGKVDFGGGTLDGETGELRIFVARYAPGGAHLASATFQGTTPPGADWLHDGESRAESSAVDPAGNVLLTGYYSGALAFGPFALPDVPIALGPYSTRGFVVKLTP